MVYIVGLNHALKVFAATAGSPANTLVNNDIVKDEVKNTVKENAQTYCNEVWITGDNGTKIEKPDRRYAEYHCEPVVLFQDMVMYRVVRFMPDP